MRIIIQRIKEARVTSQGETVGKVGAGICVFLGIARGDTEEAANYLAEKVTELRIFEDESGKMNRSVKEVNGGVLVVSEFTLYGDCTKGKRPSFSLAAPPEVAKGLYDSFIKKLLDGGLRVAAGKFQAKMEVSLVNDGPVTFILDSR